jgi:bifunctional non-homologous end joining protein LigD
VRAEIGAFKGGLRKAAGKRENPLMVHQTKRSRGPGAKAPFPGFIPPALATRNSKPPSGHHWLHEIKFDGYRAQISIRDETIAVLTRRGNDWTDRFRKIAADAWLIKADSAIIDGEVVISAPDGTFDFNRLQKALRSSRPSQDLVMYAFDLLYLNGSDLRKLPLVERKTALRQLLEGTEIRYSESFEVEGAAMFKQACAMGLEGIVSKLRDSAYHSDRTDSWRKVTCRIRETLIITGYALKEGGFDGLYLGRMEGNRLIYAGKVEHGFDVQDQCHVMSQMKKLVQPTQPYAVKVKKPNAVWIRPGLLAEIEYRALTESGKLRHPSFKGIREDL